jgi:hypothetical protein
MRFIPFIIAGGAMLTFFNTDAYATPLQMDNAGQLKASWCAGFSDIGCAAHCISEGFHRHLCSSKYVRTSNALLPASDADMLITGFVLAGKLLSAFFSNFRPDAGLCFNNFNLND